MSKEKFEARLRVLRERGLEQTLKDRAAELSKAYQEEVMNAFTPHEVGTISRFMYKLVAERAGKKLTDQEAGEKLSHIEFEVFAGLILTGLQLVALMQSAEAIEGGSN